MPILQTASPSRCFVCCYEIVFSIYVAAVEAVGGNNDVGIVKSVAASLEAVPCHFTLLTCIN